jgi:hypothetical protein
MGFCIERLGLAFWVWFLHYIHSLLFYRAVLVLLKTFVEGRWIGSAWSWSAPLSFRVVVFGLIPQEKYSFVKRGTSADE